MPSSRRCLQGSIGGGFPCVAVRHHHRHRQRPPAEADRRSAPVELRRHGVIGTPLTVSVRTVRKWLARFRAGGGAALSNRASAPARVAGRLTMATVAL
uniref:leucine zipper domain-containing protein n=1 Tax=Tabrizicola oligotrophica TaxID=2710650 RepID=UPI003899C61B